MPIDLQYAISLGSTFHHATGKATTTDGNEQRITPIACFMGAYRFAEYSGECIVDDTSA